MLRVWLLEVGHGDSIVLDYEGPNGRCFGVIDSNRESASATPAALRLLRSFAAEQLSFVLLTHPHADHFRGLHSILTAYPVDTFFSYPMRRDLARLKEAGRKYLNVALASGSDTVRDHALEFVKLLVVAEGKRVTGMEWRDLEGPTNRVRPQGFTGVTIDALLPFKKVKGEYYNALDANRPDALESPLQNELSVALDIRYGDYRVALCADATARAWNDHRRELQKANERVSFSVTKLPHHGSATDCENKVLDYLYDDNAIPKHQERLALISAEGSKHHPAPEVLRELKNRSIKPYCTNLSVVCGNNIRNVFISGNVSPEVGRLLNVAGAGGRTSVSRQPCQGNICITIPPHGAATVQRQYNNACAYRGDFDSLTVPGAQ